MMAVDPGNQFIHDPDESERFFVFDMFGTLVSNRYGNLDEIFRVFYSFFENVGPEDIQAEYERFMTDYSIEHGRLSDFSITLLMNHLDEVFGCEHDPILSEKMMMRDTHTYIAANGAADTLGFLKDNHYSIGVLSNTAYSSGTVRGLLEDVGLSEYVDTVVCSADIGMKKPSDEAYAAVLDSLGADRNKCFFAGDSRLNDYCAPNTFGMRAAFFIDPVHPSEKECVVASIGDIPAFFRN